MKVVVLYGSPRKKGTTAQLVSAFCDALPKDAEIQIFSPYDNPVNPCCGCGLCEQGWYCAYDDMDEVMEAMIECDLLVIASPVYYLTFPAPLKAVLDRTQRCFNAHRQERSPFHFKERDAIVLLAAGAPSERGDVVREQLRWLLPPLNAHMKGIVVCANTDKEIDHDAIEYAAELGSRVGR